MRRILFVSLLAIGSGALASMESNVYQYLFDLKEKTDGKDSARLNEIYRTQFENIADEIKRLREPGDEGEVKKLEAKKKNLSAEKDAASAMKTDLAGVTDIKATAWAEINDKMSAPIAEVLKAGKPAFLARVPHTPFVITQYAKADGTISTKVIYFPEGIVELKEDNSKSLALKTGNYKDLDEKVIADLVNQVNAKLGSEAQTLATGETLNLKHKSFDRLTGRTSPFGRSGAAIVALNNRLSDIGDLKTPGKELSLADDELNTLKDQSAKTARLNDLATLQRLTAQIKKGEVKLSKEADICAALSKAYGGFSKIPKSALADCKLFAPELAAAEESRIKAASTATAAADTKALSEKSSKADKDELAAQAREEEINKRTAALVSQNMALCQAMAQRASNPMPNAETKKTLAEIVQSVFTNPSVVCPTFNLVVSDVAAENFDLQAGGGADFDKAIQKEMGAMEGTDPRAQLESIKTKSDRVVQEYFVSPSQKATARGNMRDAQLALNDKLENERSQKLMKEKACLEKMASSMAALMQMRQSLNPASEQEAMAVQQVAHYNSLANMLLKAVNQEIQNTSYAASNLASDSVTTTGRSIRRGTAQEASSVRRTTPPRTNPGSTYQQSQGVNGARPRSLFGQ